MGAVTGGHDAADGMPLARSKAYTRQRLFVMSGCRFLSAPPALRNSIARAIEKGRFLL